MSTLNTLWQVFGIVFMTSLVWAWLYVLFWIIVEWNFEVNDKILFKVTRISALVWFVLSLFILW